MEKEQVQTLYDRYHLLVMHRAFAIVHDYYEAQDVCQDVFEKLCCYIEELEETQIKSWLLAVANHQAVDYMRSSYRHHEIQYSGMLDESRHPLDSMERHLWTLEYRRLEWEICERMRKENLDGLKLLRDFYVERKTHREIARAYGISEENVRTRVHRAKAWIRYHFSNRFDELKE